MSTNQIDGKLTELDNAMKKLRSSLTNLSNRVAGVGKQHTNAARKVATAITTVESAKPLFAGGSKKKPAARRR
ncbi:hypothetical protein ED92_40010 [Amycolatopsis sp. MJM2582]|uniref:hypothetical protein n=1 Tax=Amycolatopsis sp. MJM2582 TaxID=1427749 RepID=UPI000507FAA1|nr:hypothetical protein [Amycolatopsis sp. MJM2582]KFZ76884.1 hypothetical protein ED92_40010 [Amycolatopsis sp. MJM2582]